MKSAYLSLNAQDAAGHLVVTAWTSGPLLMDSVFPTSGDAPGTDPEQAGRPPESRRLMTAGVDGSPYRVNARSHQLLPLCGSRHRREVRRPDDDAVQARRIDDVVLEINPGRRGERDSIV